MKKVHYIGWYITPNDWGKYKCAIPGMMKMRYVANQIQNAGCELHILSLVDKQAKGLYGCYDTVFEGKHIHYMAGGSTKGELTLRLNNIIKHLTFILYILFKTSKKDLIVLYHSYYYTKLLAKLQRFIKRDIVIEVEEIYGYTAVGDAPWVNDEIAQIKKFKKFTCVNDGIPQVLGLKPEDYVVVYGCGVFLDRTADRFNDGKIHVVYSGTIENRKQGAPTAIEAARCLTSEYVLHVSGYARDQNDVVTIKKRIAEINEELGEERIRYEGFLSEEDLDKLLFSCHIGLSPNVLRPNFANSTFPSKIVNYMCHDLSVVISYATAYDFPISEGWVFYHEQTPECIAEAIMEAEVKPMGYYIPRLEKMNENVVAFFKEQIER